MSFVDFGGNEKSIRYKHNVVVHFLHQTHTLAKEYNLCFLLSKIIKFALIEAGNRLFKIQTTQKERKYLEHHNPSPLHLRSRRNSSSMPLLAIPSDIRADCRVCRVLPGAAEFYDVAYVRKMPLLDGGDLLGVFGVFRCLRRF